MEIDMEKWSKETIEKMRIFEIRSRLGYFDSKRWIPNKRVKNGGYYRTKKGTNPELDPFLTPYKEYERDQKMERVKNISEKYDANLSENIKKDLTEILSTFDMSKSLDLLTKKNKFGFRAEYPFIHRIALHPSFQNKRQINRGSSETESCVVYDDVTLSYEQFIYVMESGEILFATSKCMRIAKDEKSKITQKIKGVLATIGSYAALGTGILGMYGILAVGVPSAMHAGLESIDRKNEKTIEARVLNKGEVRLLQTKGILTYAELKTQQGEVLRVYDDASVLKGKIFANTIVPNLEEGKNYKFRIQESKLTGSNYCIEAESE